MNTQLNRESVHFYNGWRDFDIGRTREQNLYDHNSPSAYHDWLRGWDFGKQDSQYLDQKDSGECE